MTALEIVLAVYRGLIADCKENGIPVRLRAKRLVGTVQDDPFDCWVQEKVKAVLPSSFEVVHSGPLTTPDLIVRDRKTRQIVGLEVKKLVQRENGADSRGMTLDYNSCLPCGSTLVKVGDEAVVVPCFYVFALLSPDSGRMVSTILMDGDFLNYDFNLHKESKYANYTEYGHGPYGEGSVRHSIPISGNFTCGTSSWPRSVTLRPSTRPGADSRSRSCVKTSTETLSTTIWTMSAFKENGRRRAAR